MKLFFDYQKRKNAKHLCGTNESYFFTNKEEKPHKVVLLSSYPRNLGFCQDCAIKSGLALETADRNFITSGVIYSHTHVNPDDDLFKIIPGEELVFLSNNQEIEMWFWNFFKHVNNINLIGKCTSSIKMTHEMFSYATENIKMYQHFHNLFTQIVTGRQYLLKK